LVCKRFSIIQVFFEISALLQIIQMDKKNLLKFFKATEKHWFIKADLILG
jgi:hypothetical protein